MTADSRFPHRPLASEGAVVLQPRAPRVSVHAVCRFLRLAATVVLTRIAARFMPNRDKSWGSGPRRFKLGCVHASSGESACSAALRTVLSKIVQHSADT